MRSNRIGLSMIVVCGVTSAIALTAPTLGQTGNFWQEASIQYNPDTGRQTGEGYASGRNAVLTRISSSIHYYLDFSTNIAYFNAQVQADFHWGNPATNNRYYDNLQTRGVYTFSSFSEYQVIHNGEWFEFEEEVGIFVQGRGGLWRDDERTEMTGTLEMYVGGFNLWFTDASSRAEIYDTGHPNWLPDARVYQSVHGERTFRRVPTPGALALFGLSGLVVARRRRC